MWVTVERELTSDRGGEASIELGVSLRELADDEGTLLFGCYSTELCLVVCEEVIELGDEGLDSRDELDEPFGDEHRTEVLALGSTLSDDLSDGDDDIIQCEVLGLYFFADDSYVRLYL